MIGVYTRELYKKYSNEKLIEVIDNILDINKRLSSENLDLKYKLKCLNSGENFRIKQLGESDGRQAAYSVIKRHLGLPEDCAYSTMLRHIDDIGKYKKQYDKVLENKHPNVYVALGLSPKSSEKTAVKLINKIIKKLEELKIKNSNLKEDLNYFKEQNHHNEVKVNQLNQKVESLTDEVCVLKRLRAQPQHNKDYVQQYEADYIENLDIYYSNENLFRM